MSMIGRDIFLVGHRGSGKSTIAAQMSARGWEVVDLDDTIQELTGRAPAEIVSESVESFRELERTTLEQILDASTGEPRIIVLGAGCQTIPVLGLTVWVRREGWEHAAKNERNRLRPELTFEEEVAWMQETRTPRYREAADFVLDVARGRTAQRTAFELDALLRWADQPGFIGSKTFLVVPNPESVERAIHRVKRLGLAGVEIRSDLCPNVDTAAITAEDVPVLVSLRHAEPEWLLAHPDATSWDIELEFLPEVLSNGILDQTEPRNLIVSSHAQITPGHGVMSALAKARFTIREQAPDWFEKLTLKCAPVGVETFAQLRELLRLRAKFGGAHALLPQGPKFAWLRPVLASRSNALNYISLGIADQKGGNSDSKPMPPWDLRDWLPHLGLGRAVRFDALVGDPVDDSQGDVWHRRAAELVQLKVGYIRVPVPAAEFDQALEVMKGLGIFNFSVTSPLKRHAAELIESDEVTAVNTLQWRDEWHGCETDSRGMAAALKELEALGMEPGDVAVIGRGGVAEAVDKGIQDSDWTLAFHAAARSGWVSAPDEVSVIVNAAGPRDDIRGDAPACRAWIDLHYYNVHEVQDVEFHLNGDSFFEAQAREQRRYWGYHLPQPLDS